MVSFHTTCWTTARLPPPSTADDFDRPVCEVEKLAQVCGIDSSLSLDRVSGTTYLSVYVIMNLSS